MKNKILIALALTAFAANAAESSAVASSYGVASPGDDIITFAMNGTNHFHGVNRTGGGFEIVAEDDGRLLAFSSDGEFCETNAAPLWTMLMADTGAYVPPKQTGPIRCASNPMAPVFPEGATVSHTKVSGVMRLAATASSSTSSSTSITSDSLITDMRVEPMVKTKWGQGNGADNGIYNYYTPGKVVCGCVATAMAQIMRYHKYPTATKSVSQKTKACGYNGSVTNLTMQGGTYNWDLMELSPTSNSSNDVKQAIGKLTSDCGISVHMSYASSGSGAFNVMAAKAFTDTWRYTQSQYWFKTSEENGAAADGGMFATSINKAVLCNLDAGYPVLLGVEGSGEGHAIVGDGYGYVDGQRYIHLNLGWSGNYDYWYYFPINAGGYNYSYLDDIIYNLFPTNTGNIVSGRITDTEGKGIEGVSVSCYGYETANPKTLLKRNATTSKYGVYSVIVPNTTVYITNITATVSGYKPGAIVQKISTSKTVSYVVNEASIENNPLADSTSMSASSTPTIGNLWGNDLTLSAYLVPKFGATSALSPTDGSITLVVSTETGVKYRIEWTDDLTSGSWQSLDTFTADDTATSLKINSSKFNGTDLPPSAFFRTVIIE